MKQQYYVGLGVLTLFLGSLWFFPIDAITFGDEVQYIGHARVIAEGRLVPTAEDPFFPEIYRDDNVGIPKYPPGNAVVLAFFWLIGGASGLVFFNLFGFLVCMAAIWQAGKRLKVSPIWLSLALFHPTLFLLLRTYMSDVLGAVILLWMVLFLENKHTKSAALLAVCTLFFRAALAPVAALIFVVHFALMIFEVDRRQWRDMPLVFLIGVVGVAVLLWINQQIYGVWTLSGYSAAGFVSESSFDVGHFFKHAPYYLLLLTVMPPFLIWIGGYELIRKKDYRRLVGVVTIFVMQSSYFFVDTTPSPIETLVVGQRLILPLILLLLPGYLYFFQSRFSRFRFLPIVLLALSVIGMCVLSHSHQQVLIEQVVARAELEDITKGRVLYVGHNSSRVATLMEAPASFHRAIPELPSGVLGLFATRSPSWRRGKPAAASLIETHCNVIRRSGNYGIAECP